MSEIKKIEVLILQPVGGLRYNYQAGQVVEMPEEKAKLWIKKGLCQLLENGTIKLVHPEDAPPVPKPPKDGELPLDFPMRDLLIERELPTIKDIIDFGDLTEISGIGPAKAAEIAEALALLQEGGES